MGRSGKSRGVRAVGLGLAMVLLVAACGSSGSSKADNNNGPANDQGPDHRRHRWHAGSGWLARVRPRSRHERWLVPVQGAARHRRHPGRARDLRHAHDPGQRRQDPPVPRRVGDANQAHAVDHQAASQHQVHRRQRTRRADGEGQPRPLPQGQPAVRLRVRRREVDRRRRHAQPDRDHDGSLDGIPVVPLEQQPARNHGREADEVGELQHRPHRHRSVHQEVVEVRRQVRRDEEPELLAQGQERRPVPVPRPDHVRSPRGRAEASDVTRVG